VPSVIRNVRTGQRMEFITDRPDLLEIDTVHPVQESGAQVAAGTLHFEIGGAVQIVSAGESVTIPASTPHRFWNERPDDAHSLQWFRPALKTREFFASFFALAGDGKLDARGMPSVFQLAVMIPQFGQEIRTTRPPWLLQQLLAAVLAPVARRRGYRGRYTGSEGA
jgi:hypothetical protein